MWMGVITITATIAVCATATASRPSTAAGVRPISSNVARSGVDVRAKSTRSGSPSTGTPANWRASSKGSGRSSTDNTVTLTRNPTIENTNGPASAGRPSHSATAPPGSARFGPSTAPIVPDHTTMDSALPRRSGTARSIAAKRACKPAAVAVPKRNMPSSSSGKATVDGVSPAERTAAAMTTTAPTTASP